MKIFILTLFTLLTFSLKAETLKLATGEYSPYSGEHIPNQGISTMIVKAAFKEVKQEVNLDFMPWKRVMKYTEEAVVAGSYPWNLNANRFKKNYFSSPIHQYKAFTFHRKDKVFNTEKDIKGKILCHPSGWDFAPYADFAERMNFEVVSPVNAESCFNMMMLGRVDIVFMNELVGLDIVHKLFGNEPQIVGTEKEYFKKRVNLHFIISRKNKNGRKLMNEFNHGLEKIKANGIYESIVRTKSNCEICNRLGSL